MQHKDLILSLNKIDALKFGEFTLKSGALSPIYITLRELISYPDVMEEVAKAYQGVLKELSFDRMAAVPYAALPLVAAVAAINREPWVYTRKEAKTHGIKKPMEGVYHSGETVVVIDDLIAEGNSKFEVIEQFEAQGLKVKDVVVLLDREQGGSKKLASKGYQLHSVFNMTDILNVLEAEKVIDAQMVKTVRDFLAANQAR